MMGSAEFSTCGLHRIRLDRWWSDEPRALVCMRNPSKAGADRNVAWGNLLAPGLHADRVVAALSLDGVQPLHAFALTGDGAPIHPMARGRSRVPLGMPLIEWRAATVGATPR